MGASNTQLKESAQTGLPNKESEPANGGSEAKPVIDFELAKLYRLPDGTTKLGTEIRQAFGRGIGYDSLKSKYDKMFEEQKKTTSQLELLKEQNALLRQQVMTMQAVRDVIPKQSSQSQQQVDDWLSPGQEQSQPQQNYEAMMAEIKRQVEDTLAQYKKQIDETTTNVKADNTKYIEEQEREKVRMARLSALEKADLDMLREQYPDVSDLTIDRVSKLKKEVRSSDLNTIAIAEGKLDGDWTEVWQESKKLHDEYLKAIKDAENEQMLKNAEKEQQSGGPLFSWQTETEKLNEELKDPTKRIPIPTQDEYKAQVEAGKMSAKNKLEAMRKSLTRKSA